MKILHLADLHLGKRVNEMSMIEDQKYILDQIITLIKEESVGIVLLCGDIYDKSIPTIEAIHLLDEFLDQLSKMAIKVLMISGNHDSIDRLSFGKSLFTRSNLYIASQFERKWNHSEFLYVAICKICLYQPYISAADRLI